MAYVRFTDSGEVMSASTDSTLRLWDLPSEVSTASSAVAVCWQHDVQSIISCTAHDHADWLDRLINHRHVLLQSCTRIYRGHMNEKNFVGMSVDGEFIACGSEQNEVRAAMCTPAALGIPP